MATEEELFDSFDNSSIESIEIESDSNTDNESEKCILRAKQKHECIDGRLVYDFENHTSIPESIYSFDLVRELILDYNRLSTIPQEFCQKLCHLSVLSLMGNKLKELPTNIDLLQSLEELYIDENVLKYLPINFSNLKQLTKLHIQGNKLRALPEDFHNLNELRHLVLNENKLKSLPENFGFLNHLEELDLSFNSISCLPQSFGSLSELRVLNISHNNLSSLPSSFANLSKIDIFEVSTNSLSLLPEMFASAKCVKKLFLDNNQICSLPEWIGDMEQIEEISLKSNFLRGVQFPESFGYKSQKLIKFDISGNLIESLPESFALITTLKFIDTGSHLFEPERRKLMRQGNNIKHLPINFGINYHNMKDLRLDENDIEELPLCFGEGMPNLEIIDLYCNCIQYLPESFCKLNSLRVFSIGMNCLKKLPKNFGDLKALEELRLELNELKCLPSSFCQLTNLRVLDLYKNNFDAFPSILRELENIKSLQVGLQISKMVIKISASEYYQIERLQKALDFGVIKRTKQTFCFSATTNNNFEDNSSLQSSGYSSLNTSQDEVQQIIEHENESWDFEEFDPTQPYLNEPLVYPDSHRIQSPVEEYKNFTFSRIKSQKNISKVKKQKLSPVIGQFDS